MLSWDTGTGRGRSGCDICHNSIFYLIYYDDLISCTMPHADSTLVPEQLGFRALLWYNLTSINYSIQTKAEFWEHVHTQLKGLLDGNCNGHWVRADLGCTY